VSTAPAGTESQLQALQIEMKLPSGFDFRKIVNIEVYQLQNFSIYINAKTLKTILFQCRTYRHWPGGGAKT
jgi:hypothetical protein